MRASPLEVCVSLLYCVLGQDDTYELVFEIPVSWAGSFSVGVEPMVSIPFKRESVSKVDL